MSKEFDIEEGYWRPKYRYTLKNMPQSCKKLYDQIYSHKGKIDREGLTLKTMCDLLGEDYELAKSQRKVHSYLNIINEVETGIWESYSRKVEIVGDDVEILFEHGDGRWRIASEHYKEVHIPYCDACKILRLRAGRGHKEYEIPEDYETEQDYYTLELQSKAYEVLNFLKRGQLKALKSLTNDTLHQSFIDLKRTMQLFLLNDLLKKYDEDETKIFDELKDIKGKIHIVQKLLKEKKKKISE